MHMVSNQVILHGIELADELTNKTKENCDIGIMTSRDYTQPSNDRRWMQETIQDQVTTHMVYSHIQWYHTR